MEFYNVRDITLASGDVVQYKNFKHEDGIEYEVREFVVHNPDGSKCKKYRIAKTPPFQNV